MKMEMQSGNLLLVFIYSLSLLLIGCHFENDRITISDVSFRIATGANLYLTTTITEVR